MSGPDARTGASPVPDVADVVVVGAGVGGAAAAARLAAAGRTVTALEREPVYTDKVRGESMVNWGLEQALEMGLGDAVLQAPGACVVDRLLTYDEMHSVEQARSRARDLSTVLPGVPGLVGVGHPELRESLATEAVKQGATLHRGVHGVTVTPGERPSVTYELDGERRTVQAPVVLVADGKGSAVRRSLGITLHETTARVMLTGMLADDGGAWDRREITVGVVGTDLLFVIPRGQGALRLYVGRTLEHPERFTGPDRQQRFLAAFDVPSLPHAQQLRDARPAGPCASYPMTDSWTPAPYAPGVVLLGDAAGWSSPLTGLGLSIALRDARVLTDLLLDAGTWRDDLARAYAGERAERMRRLRFTTALTDLLTAHGTDDRAARRSRMQRCLKADPDMARAIAAIHMGPWRLPEEAFAPDILTRLALA